MVGPFSDGSYTIADGAVLSNGMSSSFLAFMQVCTSSITFPPLWVQEPRFIEKYGGDTAVR